MRFNALSIEYVFTDRVLGFPNTTLGNWFSRAGTIRNEGVTISRARARSSTFENTNRERTFAREYGNWKWHAVEVNARLFN